MGGSILSAACTSLESYPSRQTRISIWIVGSPQHICRYEKSDVPVQTKRERKEEEKRKRNNNNKYIYIHICYIISCYRPFFLIFKDYISLLIYHTKNLVLARIRTLDPTDSANFVDTHVSRGDPLFGVTC